MAELQGNAGAAVAEAADHLGATLVELTAVPGVGKAAKSGVESLVDTAVDQARKDARKDLSLGLNVDGEMIGQDGPTYSGVWGGENVGSSNAIFFKKGEDLIHFEKHGQEIAETLGQKNYSLSQYVDDANTVVRNGQFAPELNAYVSISGGEGSAKGLMVGLDRATGDITTMHLKPINFFELGFIE